MSDEEIKIGDKKIGMSTSVTLTVKTLFYFFGLLFAFLTTLFTWFYFNTINREEELKKDIHTSLNDFKRDMKDEIIPMRQQVFELAKGQGEIKTDIKSVINKQLDLDVRTDIPSNTPSNQGSSSPMSPR